MTMCTHTKMIRFIFLMCITSCVSFTTSSTLGVVYKELQEKESFKMMLIIQFALTTFFNFAHCCMTGNDYEPVAYNDYRDDHKNIAITV
jgi:hypothetical protein